MKRRNFIKTASSFVLPVMLDGLGVKAFANDSPFVKALLQTSADAQDRILVMINMGGGNDGLNTVIPIDQLTQYNAFRSNIAIPQNQILPLANTPATGFHPSMTGLQQLYNNGKLSIINAVSYPSPSQSHYRSNEIWMTGTDSNVYGNSGWMGRYIDDRYPNYPAIYPTPQMEDPLALQIGYLTSTVLASSQQSMAVALSTPEEFAELIGEGTTAPPTDLPCNNTCEAASLIAFIRKQQILSIGYAAEIKAAAFAGTTMAVYPSNNNLADQLKIVARLIHGGLKTKVYMVTQTGYDTHSEQVSTTSTTTGTHADLLKKLSDAIAAFQQDIVLQGTEDKILGMTYSEFGRRVNSNNSKGTDHGVAAPLFVFGSNVKQKMIGTNPNLSDLTVNAGQYDIKMQVDFRRVYRDILQDWFGISQSKTTELIYQNFQTTSVLSDTFKSIKTGNWNDPKTWSVGKIPSANDKVLIQVEHKVSINAGENFQCKFINILGGFETAPGAILKTTGV
jgi:uncharacterized protein (DUF1501 family)